MISYFKRKAEKNKAKKYFKEYGHHVETFELPKDGKVELAVWKNPLESPKKITQNSVDFYRKFIREGDLVIDIGSHIGDTTVPMALAAGKTGKTLAFDPNPYVFEILKINAQLNLEKTNIIPLNYAISETEGDFYYASSEASYNNGGISTTKSSSHGKYQLKETVKGINLLNYLNENHTANLPKLSFIKVDTEGYDLQIIQSVLDIVRKYRPTILAECFKKLTTPTRFELFRLFDDLGYSLYKVDDFEADTAFQKIDSKEDMKNWKHFDFYAINELNNPDNLPK